MKIKILLLILLATGFKFCDAIAQETEPNNTRAQANTLTLNGSNSGLLILPEILIGIK
jgi:hypothetical protein